jgi:tetratricopeptide (TPR) repeat protein
MNNSISKTPPELEELMNRGESLKILNYIEDIINTSNLSKELEFTYLILKCRALTNLSQHHHAIGILEEIWEDVLMNGTENQKIDILYLKARNFRFHGKFKEAVILNENAEQIIDRKKSEISSELMNKKILILLQKANLIRNLHSSAEDEKEILNHVLTLCDEFRYEYGKALALRQKSRFQINILNKEKSIKCVKEAIVISEKNQFKEILANSYGFLGEYYSFNDPTHAFQYLDKAKRIGEEIGYRSIIEGIHHSYGIASAHLNDFDAAIEHFEICLNFYKDVGINSMRIITLHNLAQIYQLKLDYNKALSILYEALAIAKEIDSERRYRGILNALVKLFISKGELNRAQRFLEENIEFFKNRSDSKVILTWAKNHLGRIHLNLGNLEDALTHFSEVLAFWEKEDPEETLDLRLSLCNVAEVYSMKGDYNHSLNLYQRSLQIGTIKGPKIGLENEFSGIINCFLEMRKLKEAKTFLDKFEHFSEGIKIDITEVAYLISKAHYLKTQNKKSNLGEAISILKNVISRGDLDFKHLISAILNLCECYILNLKLSHDESLLEELNILIERLQEISVSELTYPLLIQSYRFQAQIALLGLDISKAKELLEKAQNLAEEKEIDLLALKISNEHDLLLEKLEEWESFTQRLPAIAEIMGLTHIEIALEEMIKRKGIIVGESIIEEEDPCFLVILTQAGSILFMEQFKTEMNEEIINQFSEKIATRRIKDISGRKIERMIYQDFTCLLKQLDKIVICYSFIGKSFNGIKKLNEFSNLVQQDSQVWDILNSLDLTKQTLDSSSRITISKFIDNVFIKFSRHI